MTGWSTEYTFFPGERTDWPPHPHDPASRDWMERIIVQWRGHDRWSVNKGSWSPQEVWDNTSKEWVYGKPYDEDKMDRIRYSLTEALSIGEMLSKGCKP